MNFRKDHAYLFLLLGLGIVFWAEALVPGNMFFIRDIPSAIAAKKYSWSGLNGPTLWLPYSFFGLPHAANPQSEAFYPLNFIFSFFGPERGVVFDVVFHHLFFLITFYLALRKVGFGEEASLIGTAGFGFGGYLISLTFIPLFLRTIAWLGLLIICLNNVLETRWLKWTLCLGLVMAAQVMSGEIQLAGMSWALAFAVVVLAPGRKVRSRDLLKASGALVLGLAGSVIMNLPQIALTKELVPLSNRAAGLSLTDATEWSLSFSQLGSLFFPNYLLKLTMFPYWDLGFFYGFSYFLSHYLGVTLIIMAVFSFAAPEKSRVLFWLVLFYFGLAMILGGNLGLYPFFYKHLPGFNLFKFPEKFFLFVNFSFILLAVYGYEYLSGWKHYFSRGAWVCWLAAAVIMIFLFIHPLRIQDFGENYLAITGYLFWRNILRISILFLVGLGLILMIGKAKARWLGLGLALAIFLDLFAAHRYLNAVTAGDFFQPNAFIQELSAERKNRIVPPRILSVPPTDLDLIEKMKISPIGYLAELPNKLLADGWSVYFGLDDIRWSGGTLYPEEVNKFRKLLVGAQGKQYDQILARAGVEYFYYPDRGFAGIPGVFPRAGIYYQVRGMNDRDQAEKLWSAEDFPADQVLLIETDPEKAASGPAPLKSEPARIIEYLNEKVTVEAEAREAGWLLLLDTYYPGWKAEVDGRPEEIYRADGFFRAVRIPAGKHRVIFTYLPAILKKSVWVSGIGLLIWVGLLAAVITRGKKQEKAVCNSNKT
ncbi:MAG: YfhO family protein [bacterium]|nr:YfhO family protein [bacterium]